jgi:8-oxo-dGTP pyrophosphatase MutT (NUDIX family)
MQRINVSMKAIIVFDKKFLLVQELLNDQKFWDIPGGTIEFGEEPIATLHREIFEEVGIEVSVKETVGVYTFMSRKKDLQVVCTVFHCIPTSAPVIDITNNPAQENIINYGWFSKDDLETLVADGLLSSIAEIIKKAVHV